MKVSGKIKARRSQFPKEGGKILDALELNAGVKQFRSATVQSEARFLDDRIQKAIPYQSGKQHAASLWKK